MTFKTQLRKRIHAVSSAIVRGCYWATTMYHSGRNFLISSKNYEAFLPSKYSTLESGINVVQEINVGPRKLTNEINVGH